MAIRIDPNQEVKFEVSYLQPTFTTSYIDVQVSAAVTFPDVLSVDVVTPTDLAALTTTKALSDTYSGFLDSTTKAALKGLSDAFSMVDSADITYSIGKVLYDYPAVTEALSYFVQKELTPDSVYMVDNMDGNIEFQIVKVINELQFIADQNSLTVTKVEADSLSIADSISTLLIYQRYFADSLATPSDLVTSKTTDKGLFETIAEPDSATLSITKPFTDSSSPTDVPYKAFEKLILGIAQDYCDPTYFLEDYVLNSVTGDWLYTTNDVFSKEVTYGRNPSDTVNSADELQPFDFTKGLFDASTPQDAQSLSTSKPLQDGFYLVDNMDGDIQYQVVKVVNELQFVLDAQVIDNSVQKADNIATSDGGLVVIQDYAEPSYFLEDYVGSARTF
jgi:hypothetical protein